jgi:hypothetical protein
METHAQVDVCNELSVELNDLELALVGGGIGNTTPI